MRKIFLLLVSILLVFINPIFAEDFKITNYKIDIIVNEDKTMDIEENISVDFSAHKHGIFRDIPTSGFLKRADGKKTKYSAQVSNVRVDAPYENINRSFDGYVRLQIGSKYKTVYGEKQYNIRYKYYMGKDSVRNADEFYFNLIGDGWDTTIDRVEYSIKLPKSFDSSEVFFYTPKPSYYNYYKVIGNEIRGYYFGKIPKKTALTVKVNLPEGYFISPPLLLELAKGGIVLVFPLIVLSLAFTLWFFFGRDEKTIEVINFKPPHNINPVEVAYIFSQDVTSKDVASLVFYLASQGYIEISDDSEKVRNTEVIFELVKPYEGNDQIIKMFISKLFRYGNVVSLRSLSSSSKLSTLTSEIEKEIKNANLIFEKNSLNCQRWIGTLNILAYLIMNLIFLARIEVIFAIIHLSIFSLLAYFTTISPFLHNKILGKTILSTTLACGIAVGFFALLFLIVLLRVSYPAHPYEVICYILGIVCLIVSHVFFLIMPKWTYEGNSVYGQLLGFRRFLQKVKIREIKQKMEKEPNYVYDVLPYALVFGLAEERITRLLSLNNEAPHYYKGSYSSLTFYDSVSSLQDSMSRCFSPASSGGSSGGFSGGGGSCGGGGGGGGGGSW